MRFQFGPAVRLLVEVWHERTGLDVLRAFQPKAHVSLVVIL